ncbi:hypothetical protein CC78DRAFT_595065 [Lojkania enalia]|uniref:Uncharacterized protein n=1 Tax=Lojkania enalia TaxID=147567 RepID=A0A9P4MYC5_9PLEO|nr:hypothetical protein CC78DRAFT_595065 [Didymosphaeria enalia]
MKHTSIIALSFLTSGIQAMPFTFLRAMPSSSLHPKRQATATNRLSYWPRQAQIESTVTRIDRSSYLPRQAHVEKMVMVVEGPLIIPRNEEVAKTEFARLKSRPEMAERGRSRHNIVGGGEDISNKRVDSDNTSTDKRGRWGYNLVDFDSPWSSAQHPALRSFRNRNRTIAKYRGQRFNSISMAFGL